jgi:hypothetical protein
MAKIGWRTVVPTVPALAAASVLVAVLTGDGGDRRTEVRAGSPGTVTTAVPTTATSAAQTADDERGGIVWADAGDVWVYDASAGERRKLTSDGERRWDALPRFRDAVRVTYLSYAEGIGQSDLYAAVPRLVEVNLTTGAVHELRRFDGPVRAYDWSAGGGTLAWYRGGGDAQDSELHVIDPAGRDTTLRRFGPTLGRGGYVNYDETRVEWSGDGRRLLVVDTTLDTSQDETLFVLDDGGRDVLAPRLGTWARWSGNGEKIYCSCAPPVPATSGDLLWQAIDVATGAATPLPVTEGARPSVSPDGRFLAYDDGLDTPGVHVLDLDDPLLRTRLLARGAVAPVWLAPSRMAVTDTRPCPHDEDTCIAGGHGSMFEPAGSASAVDARTGDRTPLPPMDTDGADSAFPD